MADDFPGMTLLPRSQLVAGLQAFLIPKLGSAVPPGGVRFANAPPDLVAQLRVGTYGPMLTIVLDATRPLRGSSPRGKIASVVTGAAQQEALVLYEQAVLSTPLHFVCTAGGDTGGTDAETLAARVASLLGDDDGATDTLTLPLPDSMETEDVVDPALTMFKLTAELQYEGEMEDQRREAEDVHRYELLYTATHSRYRLRRAPLVRRVEMGIIAGLAVDDQDAALIGT